MEPLLSVSRQRQHKFSTSEGREAHKVSSWVTKLSVWDTFPSEAQVAGVEVEHCSPAELWFLWTWMDLQCRWCGIQKSVHR